MNKLTDCDLIGWRLDTGTGGSEINVTDYDGRDYYLNRHEIIAMTKALKIEPSELTGDE